MPRANTLRLRRQFETALDTREQTQKRWRALTGDGAGNIEVPNKRNFIYIRRQGRSYMEECQNTRVPRRYNLPIIVGTDPNNPDTLQVLEPDWGGMADPTNYPYVPYHHESHEFENVDGGDDVIWTQKQQLTPLLAYPTDPESMTVNVYGGWYCWADSWHYFDAAVSADLTGSIPGVAGTARYTLISIDGATEALQYTDGATFPILLPPADREDMIPAAPGGSIPIVAVYLPNGVTALGWTNLYDIRILFATAGLLVPHALLSATHNDTIVNPPSQGAMIIGNGTPLWVRLAAGSLRQFLQMDGAGNQPQWTSFDWDLAAAAVAADMVHDHSADAEGGVLNLSGAWITSRITGELDWTPDTPALYDVTTNTIIEYATIQGALDDCDDDDIVLVPPGVYAENLTWPAKDGVYLVGWNGSGAADGGRSALVVGAFSATTSIIVAGMALTGNFTLNGAGAYLQLVHSWLTGNVVNGGVAGDLFLENAVIAGSIDVDDLIIWNSRITGARVVAGTTTYQGEVFYADTVGAHTHESAAEGGEDIRPDSLAVNTAVPDQDGAIAQAEVAADPSGGGAGTTRIYSKDDAGQSKYFFMDDAGSVYEIAGIVEDLTVTVGAGGDFATIQAAIDWFKNWIVKGTCYIDVDAGAYDEAVSFANLLIAPGAYLVLRGDTRVLAGLTYIDDVACNSAGLANGGSGNCSLSNLGAVITVVGATTSPDFDADGWGLNDRLLVYDNAGNRTIYTIQATLNNTITLTIAAPAIGNAGTAICLLPNRSVDRSVAGACVTVTGARGVALSGWYIETAAGAGCNGVVAAAGAIVYLSAMTTYAEDYGVYGASGNSYFETSSAFGSRTLSMWGAVANSYGALMAFAGAVLVYARSVGPTYGFISQDGSFLYVEAGAAVRSTTGYLSRRQAMLNATSSPARQNTNGFVSESNSTMYAASTMATSAGQNVVDYTPNPAGAGLYAEDANNFGVLYKS